VLVARMARVVRAMRWREFMIAYVDWCRFFVGVGVVSELLVLDR
jgi:hypothetical protein